MTTTTLTPHSTAIHGPLARPHIPTPRTRVRCAIGCLVDHQRRAAGTFTTLTATGNLSVEGATIGLRGVAYTLPVADGSSDYILVTDGAGNLAWQDVTTTGGAGDITTIGDCTSGACFAGAQGTALTFVGQDSRLNISNSGTLKVRDAAGNDLLTVYDAGSTGNVNVTGTLATSGAVTVGGNLTLGSNSLITAAATLASTELDLLDGGITFSELTDSGTLTATTVDINGGNIDGTTIGATSAAAAPISARKAFIC